jgi:hypothetical protein
MQFVSSSLCSSNSNLGIWLISNICYVIYFTFMVIKLIYTVLLIPLSLIYYYHKQHAEDRRGNLAPLSSSQLPGKAQKPRAKGRKPLVSTRLQLHRALLRSNTRPLRLQNNHPLETKIPCYRELLQSCSWTRHFVHLWGVYLQWST